MQGAVDIQDLWHIPAWVLEQNMLLNSAKSSYSLFYSQSNERNKDWIKTKNILADSKCKTLTFSNRSATLVRISFITRWTDAVGPMVPYFTDSIYSTLIVVNTGIFALLADTCKSCRTVTINGTLRATFWIWIPLETGWTGALTVGSGWSGNSIYSTWIWVTRIHNHRIRSRRPSTFNQSVSNISG